MILDILGIVFPSFVLLTGIISLVGSIKKGERGLILKDITIMVLSLNLIMIAIKQM